MGFWEDFLVNAKDNVKVAAENVGKFAGGVVDFSKLKIDCAEISKKLNAEYLNLGKMVYDASINGSYDKEATEEKLQAITELKNQLENLENKVVDLKNKCKCKECGAVNSSDACYCSKCGAKLEKPEKPEIIEEPENSEEAPETATEPETVEVSNDEEVEEVNDNEFTENM